MMRPCLGLCFGLSVSIRVNLWPILWNGQLAIGNWQLAIGNALAVFSGFR